MIVSRRTKQKCCLSVCRLSFYQVFFFLFFFFPQQQQSLASVQPFWRMYVSYLPTYALRREPQRFAESISGACYMRCCPCFSSLRGLRFPASLSSCLCQVMDYVCGINLWSMYVCMYVCYLTSVLVFFSLRGLIKFTLRLFLCLCRCLCLCLCLRLLSLFLLRASGDGLHPRGERNRAGLAGRPPPLPLRPRRRPHHAQPRHAREALLPAPGEDERAPLAPKKVRAGGGRASEAHCIYLRRDKYKYIKCFLTRKFHVFVVCFSARSVPFVSLSAGKQVSFPMCSSLVVVVHGIPIPL